MTDIFIKSFNRPFYLDRSIASVYKFVSGNFQIKVLDDGTPEEYLDKIRAKYPKVQILLSDNYQKKVKAIDDNLSTGKAVNGFEIPTKFWFDNVKNGSDYVIVTEDDVWFTNPINVDKICDEAKNFDISLLKLGWLGNKSERQDLDMKSISEDIESAKPKGLLFFPKKLTEAFFYNHYKFYTILYKLGKADNTTQRKYWALNSILMGFFNKKYWLEIWKEMDGKVDEKRQLINASVFYRKHRQNPNFVCRLKTESMKTTFQSSATNSYHEYGFDFDVNIFNHLINRAWLKGDFDVLENFPGDFSKQYIKSFVESEINFPEFEKWADQFRKQYENMGCQTE